MTSETPDRPEHSDIPENANAADTVVWRFDFRGSSIEFFTIWAANVLLTIATLGLFSPWAKVRTRRYFHGSAFLNGVNFDYHASPWSILFARFLVVLVIVGGAYLAGEGLLQNAVHSTLVFLLLPWAIVLGLAFNARYSSHRGARFAFKKETRAAYAIAAPYLALLILPGYAAAFAADAADLGSMSALAQLVGAMTALAFLCALSAAPWLLRAWHDFKARNHSIGTIQFHLKSPPMRDYLAALWIVPLLGLAALAALILPQFQLATEENIATRGVIAIFSAYIMMLLTFTFAGAKLFHTFWNHLRFSIGEESGRFRADFSPWEFAVKILTVNYIAILFSLWMLYPWTKIRRAKYLAAHMSLETTPAALDKIPGLRAGDQHALGEEIDAAEGFDFDVGLV